MQRLELRSRERIHRRATGAAEREPGDALGRWPSTPRAVPGAPLRWRIACPAVAGPTAPTVLPCPVGPISIEGFEPAPRGGTDVYPRRVARWSYVPQVAANRKNAQRSTGPRTQDGKARSRQSALRHGVYASVEVAVERGPFAEDPEEVDELLAQSVCRPCHVLRGRGCVLMNRTRWRPGKSRGWWRCRDAVA